MASLHHPPRRGPECDCGLPILNETRGVRMVPGQPVLPMGPTTSSAPSGRSFHHELQPQASLLCGPQPGPSGVCLGRSINQLEPVEQFLSLPPSHPSIKSSTQTPNLPWPDSPHSSQLGQEQLTLANNGAPSPTPAPPQSSFIPDGPNKDCISFILANQGIGFMDFLTHAANRRFDIDSPNVLFTEKDKGNSVIRQYNSSFRHLAEFNERTKTFPHVPQFGHYLLSLPS